MRRKGTREREKKRKNERRVKGLRKELGGMDQHRERWRERERIAN